MPAEWKNLAEKIGQSLKSQGKPDKAAESEGYAIATKQYMEKHHGQTPQSADKKPKKRAKRSVVAPETASSQRAGYDDYPDDGEDQY